ncbi:MAG: hypothetical protein CMF52_08820 [Legionellales bacterium]|nr:hypothetical protein [Legionellales bacterium]
MKRELLCGLGIAVTVTALSAFNAMAENFTVTGTVTSVEPVYATRTINEPVKSCWTEQVPVYSQGKNNDAQAFGMDLEGAIIGGAIANNVLKGDNTGALGAIVGGLIGSDMKSKKNQQITGYREVQKCNNTFNTRTEEYRAGYKIEYQALGLIGTITSTNSRNVGDRIDVNVQISAY